MDEPNCSDCPVQEAKIAASAVIVQLQDDGITWKLQTKGTPVHLAALFRDPEIGDKSRVVSTVLDLRTGPQGKLATGKNCWVDKFLDALPGLPIGLTVALDNGVRCPCGTANGFEPYFERAKCCHKQTVRWFSELRHPDGATPSIVICDKDLACSLAKLRLLHYRSGGVWQNPRRFVEAVGDEVTYLGADAMILAHPVVLRRDPLYRQTFLDRKLSQKLSVLARLAAA
jgi:hypothetical protein